MKQANEYAQLEIRILKREAGGYPVELTLDGSQQFGGGHLKADLLPWVPTASPEGDGERLFNHLFGDGRLRQQWAEIRGRQPQRRVRLRIDAEAPELHAIPWELLRDTTAADEPQTLAATAATPFSRYIAGTWSPGQPVSQRPIKILAAIANPHNLSDFGLPAIAVDDEWRLIREATERLEVELVRLPQPCTLSALEAALKEGPHILHLVGHGAYSQRREQAQLYLADQDNRVALVSEAEFAAMIDRQLASGETQRDDQLRLIFLASCQTASRSPADAFRGFAPALIKAGVPAVLAMQDLIPVETARGFSRAFYAELLEHGQVDRACNGARAALLTARLPGSSIPVLFSRLIDNQLLAPSLSIHEQAYRERVKARFAEDAAYYIDLAGETTETVPVQTELKASRSARRRKIRPEYREWVQTEQELKEIKLETLREGVDKYPCVILLGEPGSGKTTALENLAYQFATESEKLPLPLRLSEFGPGMTVEDFILQGWSSSADTGHWGAAELAANLRDYLEAGKLFLLFDALNEMPRRGYKERAQALRDFIERWSQAGNRFLVTCRVLDYGEELSGLQRVEVQLLNDEQIRTFLQLELPEDWEHLWEQLMEERDKQRRLLAMARNPYILTMMIDVFAEDGQLGQSRAALMTRFTQVLFDKEKAKTPLAEGLAVEAQQASLAHMAFEMQKRAGSGSVVETELVKMVMPAEVEVNPAWPAVATPPDQVLTLAARANIIEMPVDRSTVRFYHQLLQEYFAAHALLKADPAKLTELWRWPWLEKEMLPVGQRGYWDSLPPPPQTGWEEATILAAGLAPENDNQLVRALIKVNPVLAGRCLHEGQAKVDKAIRQEVIEALLEIIARPEVALRVRIAAGDVLGYLGDPRPGQMVTVPAGKFIMGDNRGLRYEKPQHELFMPEYRIGKYPLTNVEYARFIEARGYRKKRWWTKAGWKWKGGRNQPSYWQDSRFDKPNQPVVGISWYECVAYCRWLSAETGQTYRLPTEAEWEKAARGQDGQAYPWGSKFEAGRLNAKEGEQQVNTITPVGIYPTGVSPFGVFDSAGNVWEWCATQWRKAYPYDVQEDEWARDYLEATSDRVLRGGSWLGDQGSAGCARRRRNYPYLHNRDFGCRLVVSPIEDF